MANYKVDDTFAIIEIDYPPVNALSLPVREGIIKGLENANNDQSVEAIIVVGAGSSWPSGADISEFATGAAMILPTIVEVANGLENSPKPVIAALHGNVLGGGLEIAISTHYRVAHEKTRFGYPEVNLGILPAATGTQKFPRLCGLKAALDYIPTGKHFGVREAQNIGLLDQVVSSDVLEAAKKLATAVKHLPLEGRRTCNMKVKDAERATELADAAIIDAKRRSRGMLAPIMNIQAVLASVNMPLEKGLEKEKELVGVLFTSGQAQALQYAFFAQRAASKWAIRGRANPKQARGQVIKTGAVIGAGTMGTGIAMAMLNAGIPVTLIEQSKEMLDRGVSTLRQLYFGSVDRRLITEQQAQMILSQLKPSLDFNDIASADIVVEAVYENLELKRSIFKKLDAVCKPDAILTTNTSYLGIDLIASATSRPDKVIGTHFFVPAYYMKLLENVYHPQVSPTTVATAMDFGKRIGKIPVLVGTCDGFVGNRMQSKYITEASFLLEEGCLPQQVDWVLEDFGFPLGVFKVSDLSGLDVAWRSRQDRAKALGLPPNFKGRFVRGTRVSYLFDLLCEAGRLGRKAGKGWYRYEKAAAKVPQIDPWVDETVLNYSRKEGITRRRILDQEILERCVYSMVNEGFKILEEGVASKPEDVDTIWLLGYGFPRYRGGPMFYASQVGLKRVYERVCYYYQQDPCSEHWMPSPLLERLARFEPPIQGWMSHLQSHL